MSQPYIGEIRMFGGPFAPAEWMTCDGQLLSVSEYELLFAVIGTSYGGDGQETFALPDLRGRIPIHQGQGAGLQNYIIAQAAGVEAVTLTTQQLPVHNHAMLGANSVANDPNPANNVPGESSAISMYQSANPTAPMGPQMLGPVGSSQPHDNLQPYQCVNFIISLFGIYPNPS